MDEVINILEKEIVLKQKAHQKNWKCQKESQKYLLRTAKHKWVCNQVTTRENKFCFYLSDYLLLLTFIAQLYSAKRCPAKMYSPGAEKETHHLKFFGHHSQLKCAPTLCKNTPWLASDFTEYSIIFFSTTFWRLWRRKRLWNKNA